MVVLLDVVFEFILGQSSLANLDDKRMSDLAIFQPADSGEEFER